MSVFLFLPSCNFFILSNPCFFIFAKGAYDEGPDGPLRVPSDSGGLCKDEGGGDEGGVGGAEGMEGHLGEQA